MLKPKLSELYKSLYCIVVKGGPDIDFVPRRKVYMKSTKMLKITK